MGYLERVPDPINSRIKYQEESDEARANPGEWFKLLTKPTGNSAWSAATQIKNGRRAAFRPAGSFDAVTRGTDVLIKYVGDDQAGL